MIFSPPHLLDGPRWAGLRIGLLGGSFNPPHEGHIHISRIALQSLGLDFVWWLVTPHNPLKERESLMPYADRMDLSRRIVQQEPHILVTDLESRLGVNRTWDTLTGIKRYFPKTDFVLMTGMDNALSFHLWYRWKDILKQVPTAHIARPPAWSLIESCPLRELRGQTHIYIEGGARPELKTRTSYWMLQRKMQNLSSTEIRSGQTTPL